MVGSGTKPLTSPRPALSVLRVDDARAERAHGAAAPHRRLVWAPRGSLLVETSLRTWLIPQTLGLWIPAETLYVLSAAAGSAYVLEFRDQRFGPHWTAPTVVAITPFVRESIVRLLRVDLSADARQHVEAVVRDALQRFDEAGFDLPHPSDARARQVADALLRRPADRRTLAELGRDVGASVRTLRRLFFAETGLTFAEWRKQVRMRHAAAELKRGRPVAEAARSVGYQSTSAFAHAYRRTTGYPPTATRATTSALGD